MTATEMVRYSSNKLSETNAAAGLVIDEESPDEEDERNARALHGHSKQGMYTIYDVDMPSTNNST